MKLARALARSLLAAKFGWRHNSTKLINSSQRSRVRGFYSQDGQDTFVYSEFFRQITSNEVPPLFLDIGCNHPVDYSNSYFFERHLGFRCIAVDPLPTYREAWAALRPRSAFFEVALGSKAGTATLLTPRDGVRKVEQAHGRDMFSTLVPRAAKVDVSDFQERVVAVRTAADLLDEQGVTDIGIMSIDVEGFELDVLKGFDFTRHKAEIILVENNSDGVFGSQAVRDLLCANGYQYYARFWRMDDVFVSDRLERSAGAQSLAA